MQPGKVTSVVRKKIRDKFKGSALLALADCRAPPPASVVYKRVFANPRVRGAADESPPRRLPSGEGSGGSAGRKAADRASADIELYISIS